MREHLADVDGCVNSALRRHRRMGATWAWSQNEPSTVIVTWPTTSAYKNAVARGLVFERFEDYSCLLVRHEVASAAGMTPKRTRSGRAVT
jgi:hypothetical protein